MKKKENINIFIFVLCAQEEHCDRRTVAHSEKKNLSKRQREKENKLKKKFVSLFACGLLELYASFYHVIFFCIPFFRSVGAAQMVQHQSL